MKTIEKEYFIAVPPALLWETMTVPLQIEAWGAGPDVVMNLTEGGAFSLWGGDIHGENIDIDPEVRLVQTWYTDGHDYATEVTFVLEPNEEGTTVTVTQTNVAEEDAEEFERGWDEYYFGPLKEFCEQ